MLESRKIRMSYDEKSGIVTLQINQVGPGDEGEYTCSAKNQYGKKFLAYKGSFHLEYSLNTFTFQVKLFAQFIYSQRDLVLQHNSQIVTRKNLRKAFR